MAVLALNSSNGLHKVDGSGKDSAINFQRSVDGHLLRVKIWHNGNESTEFLTKADVAVLKDYLDTNFSKE